MTDTLAFYRELIGALVVRKAADFAAFVDLFKCVGGTCFVQELCVFDLLTQLSHLRSPAAS